MIRGGSRSGRIACLLVGVSAALAAAAPTASAQPAVDEYTLDIPGGGGGGDSADPGASTGGNGGASASGGGAGGGESSARSAERGAEGTASEGSGGAARGEELNSSGSTGAGGSLDTSSRSAPEVVADTLFDGAMLPILVALVLITGVGAWRVLRHRRTWSGQAG
jgi:hypothetical protein